VVPDPLLLRLLKPIGDEEEEELAEANIFLRALASGSGLLSSVFQLPKRCRRAIVSSYVHAHNHNNYT